ncbi:MAG: hypothetical protein ACE5NL_00110 [Candidatus Hydrothermarchaeaceae archaeon]
MEIRTIVVVGLGILIFTQYYLEKELTKEQIFWLFSGAGAALGAMAAYTVAKNMPSRDYYITFSVLCILLAILYYKEEAGKEIKPKKKSR